MQWNVNLETLIEARHVERQEAVAQRLGVGVMTLRSWAAEGRIPYVRFDREPLFSFGDVVRAVQRARGASGIELVSAIRHRRCEGELPAQPGDVDDSPLPPPPPPMRRHDPVGRPEGRPGYAPERPERYAHRLVDDGNWDSELVGVQRSRNTGNLARVYSLIRNSGRGGIADFEGMALADLPLNQYAPRRCELRDAGLVLRKPHERRRTPHDKTAAVWVAAAVLSEGERAAYLAAQEAIEAAAV